MKMRLKNITSYDVEKWLLDFSKRGLSNQTANVNLTCLNVMFNDAIRRKLLDKNPAANVTTLKESPRVRDILSSVEVGLIFDSRSVEKIWNKKVYYLANLLSACIYKQLVCLFQAFCISCLMKMSFFACFLGTN